MHERKTLTVCLATGLLLSTLTAFPTSAEEQATTYRAARSVHLGYPAPGSGLFYNEVVVEKSVNGSYFMACGWDTGYFGIQQLDRPEQKVVLFSVWDPTHGDDPNAVKNEERVKVLYEGEGVRIKRFGGEGTGGQCMWNFKWNIGQTNRFLIGAAAEGTNTAYTAWFSGGNSWKKLATFQTRTGGRLLNGYYSFIEDFRRDTKSVMDERRARFANGCIKTTEGSWTPLLKARFTASISEWESRDNIDAGIEDGWFFLATGGPIKMSRELRSVIELSGSGSEMKGPVDLPADLDPKSSKH